MGATRASHGLTREGQPRVESRQTPAHRAPPPQVAGLRCKNALVFARGTLGGAWVRRMRRTG